MSVEAGRGCVYCDLCQFVFCSGCKDHPKDSLGFNNSWHNRTSKIADFPTVPVLILDLCIWLSWLQFNGFWKLQFKLRLRIMVSKKWIDQFSCQFWPFMAENFLGPDLLSPSGDLGIGLVWDNHPDPTNFLVPLLKSSSNWTKLSMRGPQLFSGWYQMIFRLGSD